MRISWRWRDSRRKRERPPMAEIPTIGRKAPTLTPTGMSGTVLVTGGTGAFGQAFVDKLLAYHPNTIIRVLSRGEAKQAAMRARLEDNPRLRWIVGDVRDFSRMRKACRGADYVVHAAALKRIEVGESDVDEAIKTNVFGSMAVRDAAIECQVWRSVLLSTDKAVAPNTAYGASKTLAERLWNRGNVYAAGTDCRFAATRYGNVLGSTGSVVPIWMKQANDTGSITVTNPEMSRFWMTMDQACALVFKALQTMRGGEVIIPKIPAATISVLAEAVVPGARRVTVGSRPGEKLHESLMGADESISAYDAGTHLIIEPQDVSWDQHRVSPVRDYTKVPDRFTYDSDTAPQLTVNELRGML